MAIDAGLATTVVCGYVRDSWSRTNSVRGKKATPEPCPRRAASQGARTRIRPTKDPRMVSNVIGIAPEKVACDMRIGVVFEDIPGVTLPKFTVAA
jgi:hypothetical protein